MQKVYFCKECRKIFLEQNSCTCMGENHIGEIKIGSPVNVIGTKLKGKIHRIKSDSVDLIITSSPKKYIKQYNFTDIQKII